MLKSRLTRLACSVALGASTMACAMPMRPVEFSGTPAAWQMLAGQWHGEYWMRPYDRHGMIAFTLTASTEQASGNVLMISDRFGSPYQGYPRGPDPSAPREPRTELMTIQFVRADDGQISGRLDPYWDPNRRCRASAWFVGSVHGDIMRGTFSSVCEDRGWPSNGRWKVTRKRSTGDN